MAYRVETAFDEFFKAINMPGDHRTTANARREWIVGRLRPKFTIVDSFATGSIPRFTAVTGPTRTSTSSLSCTTGPCHSAIRADCNRIVTRETRTREYATIATWSGAD